MQPLGGHAAAILWYGQSGHADGLARTFPNADDDAFGFRPAEHFGVEVGIRFEGLPSEEPVVSGNDVRKTEAPVGVGDCRPEEGRPIAVELGNEGELLIGSPIFRGWAVRGLRGGSKAIKSDPHSPQKEKPGG